MSATRQIVRFTLTAMISGLITVAFAAHQLGEPLPSRETIPLMTAVPTSTSIDSQHPDDHPPYKGDEVDIPIDLLGNEVIDAVAKYKLDATGSLYELHSPQTELPRLSPPKS